MKKRSLVAAIAMLVVSAIVLTSATYAWFTSTSSAKVESISATVTNANGKLQIKADQAATANEPQWSSRLLPSEFSVTATLNPVSMSYDPSVGVGDTEPFFAKVAFDGTGYTSIKTTQDTVPQTGSTDAYPIANTDYIHYGFDVKYTNDETTAQTIYIKPTFTRNDGNFTYALVKFTRNVSGTSTTTYYIFDSSDSYVPVRALSGSALDAAGHKVLDDHDGSKAYIAYVDSTHGDTGYNSADMGNYSACTSWNTTNVPNGELTFSATGKASPDAESVVSSADIEVWIWAEGQDANCTGTISGQSTGMTFDLALTSFA